MGERHRKTCVEALASAIPRPRAVRPRPCWLFPEHPSAASTTSSRARCTTHATPALGSKARRRSGTTVTGAEARTPVVEQDRLVQPRRLPCQRVLLDGRPVASQHSQRGSFQALGHAPRLRGTPRDGLEASPFAPVPHFASPDCSRPDRRQACSSHPRFPRARRDRPNGDGQLARYCSSFR
jgi:hypothetical protein